MSIPISSIVDVQITRDTSFPDGFSFNSVNLLGTSDVITTDERIRFYQTIDEVQSDFGTSAEEYKAALIYFSNNPRPPSLYISRWANVDTNAQLRCGLGATTAIAEWSVVADGSFRISIDGVAANVTTLNFTSSTTLSNVALVIQNGLVAAGFAGATCVYSTSEGRFIIKSGTAGITSTITVLSTSTATVGTDISGLGGTPFLDGAANGITVQGIAAEQIDAALGLIEDKNNQWYMLACVSSVRDDSDARAVASWCEARVKMFINATNDTGTIDTGNTSNIAYELNALNRVRTTLIYHKEATQYPDLGICAYGGITEPGSATLKFKTLPGGITTSDELKSNQAKIATGRGCNVYVNIAGKRMVQEGTVIGGEFFDIMRGVDAMTFEIERNVFGLLASKPKIPMTDSGVALIIAEVSSSLLKFVNIGFLAARDFYDEAGEYERSEPAYNITAAPISTLSAAQRADRIAPDIIFTAYLAGAIHFVKIRGTVTV